MYTGKVVKMEYEQRSILDKALKLLESQIKFLEKLKDKDGEIKNILDNGNFAWTALSDYLDAYESQLTK